MYRRRPGGTGFECPTTVAFDVRSDDGRGGAGRERRLDVPPPVLIVLPVEFPSAPVVDRVGQRLVGTERQGALFEEVEARVGRVDANRAVVGFDAEGDPVAPLAADQPGVVAGVEGVVDLEAPAPAERRSASDRRRRRVALRDGERVSP